MANTGILISPNSCGAGENAQELFELLSQDLDINFPVVDFDKPEFQLPSHDDNPLYDKVKPITIEELTEKKLVGNGAFDVLMSTIDLHLEKQYKLKRITGKEYADVYVSLVQTALGTGLQFLLGKDQAYWSALNVQMQARRAEYEAITAAVGLVTAQVNYAAVKATALGASADYSLTKMKLSTEDAQYCNIVAQKKVIDEQYENAYAQTKSTRSDGTPVKGVIGASLDQTLAQTKLLTEQFEAAYAQTNDTKSDGSPLQGIMAQQLETARAQVEATKEGVETARAQTLDTRKDGSPVSGMLGAQKKILGEQFEVARSQTQDKRSDGQTVTGTVGAQNALYKQQKIAYERDVDYKIAKMYMDQWIAQKSIDEGLTAPTQFVNAEIDKVFVKLRANASLQ